MLFMERIPTDIEETNEIIYVETSNIISNDVQINAKKLET